MIIQIIGTIHLPANITFVGVTSTQGTCTPAPSVVNCDLGTLANGANATVSIIIRPNYGAQNTTLSSTATVSALQVDTVVANNTVIATTRVNASTGAPMPYFYTTPTPELTWSPISWATNYEVEVSSTVGFAPIKFQDDTLPPTQLSRVVTTPLSDGLWYWRVRAKKADGNWGAWSTPIAFVVDQP